MTNSSLSSDDRLARARLQVGMKGPYYVPLLLGLIPKPCSEIPTVATTPGMHLLYNPEFIASLTDKQLASELVHECHHHMHFHFERSRNIPPEDRPLLNLAQDFSFNPHIRQAKWDLHPTWVFPEQVGLPDNLLMEEYLEELKKMRDKEKKKLEELLKNARKCFAPKDLQEKLDSVSGRPLPERKQLVQQTMGAAKEYSQSRGHIPGFGSSVFDQLNNEHKIRWEDKLQHLVTNATGEVLCGGSDFSLRHPSKRSYTRHILRPGLIDQLIIPMFVIDTSGSMQVPMLVRALTESCNILEQLGMQQAWFVQVDAAVVEEPQLMSLDDLRALREFKGRGGTSFIPAFELLDKLSPKPDVLFYFTDGDGVAPTEPPFGTQVVWGLIPHHAHFYQSRRPALWGHLVVIDDHDPPLEESALAPPHGAENR